MSSALIALEAVALAAFLVALGIVVATPVRRPGMLSASGRAFMVCALAVYVIALAAMILGRLGGVSTADPTEVAIETLFPAFVVYSAHSFVIRQRENDLARSSDALKRSNEFMIDIMDNTPAGIMVLDRMGWIVFANEAARGCLDLFEDASTGGVDQPGWVVEDQRPGAGEPRPDFSAFMNGRPVREVPVTVVWPSGWRRRLLLSVVPMKDSHGVVGGAMAAFVDQPENAR